MKAVYDPELRAYRYPEADLIYSALRACITGELRIWTLAQHIALRDAMRDDLDAADIAVRLILEDKTPDDVKRELIRNREPDPDDAFLAQRGADHAHQF